MNLIITNGSETILAVEGNGMVLVPRLDNERTAAFELLCRALATLSEVNPPFAAMEGGTDERATETAQDQTGQKADDCATQSTQSGSQILEFRPR